MKILSCVFFDDVLCSFRRSEKSGIMDRCMNCEHFARFNREMQKEEEEFFEEEGWFRSAQFCLICACKLDDDSRSDVFHLCRRCSGTLEM